MKNETTPKSRPSWPNQRTTTVAPPSGYTALVSSSRRAQLAVTLPVDETSNAALCAMRDEVVSNLYSSLEVQS